jgi:hypothetical protein
MLPNVECITVTSSNTQKRDSTKDYVRIYQLFMQNKPNSKLVNNNINSFVTSKYGQMDNWLFRKQSQKTNPIQSQFKPKQTQFNPIQTQNKANFVTVRVPVSNDINGLDNNLPNCYISFPVFMLKNVKIGKRIIQ